MEVVTPASHNDSERGAISVSIVIAIGVVAVAVYVILGATVGDPTKYGAVTVPGKAQVELPGGDADFFFTELTTSTDIQAPQGMKVLVTDQSGNAVSTDTRSTPEQTDDGSRRIELIGQVDPPTDGLYNVEVEIDPSTGALPNQPQVTFGESPFGAVAQRWDNVLDTLRGPVGLGVIVVLLGLLVWPALKRRSEAARYEDEY
jgi:hypothetical protein